MANGIAAPAIVAQPVITPTPAASAEVSEAGGMAHMHDATPERVAAASPGTPVARDGLVVTLGVSGERAGPVDITAKVTDDAGAPVAGARVAIVSEMSGMPGREETAASETAPGRYLAPGVPLSMAGEWRLSVRISPRAQPTRIVPFVVEVQ